MNENAHNGVRKVHNGIMPESQDLKRSFEALLMEGASSLGLTMEKKTVEMLRGYGQEILFWNRSVNLVSADTIGDLAVRHFHGSLTLLPLLPRKPFGLLDMGTGAGLPGIPLKMVRPDAYVVLVDSSRKKQSFLKEMIRHFSLDGIVAEQARIEDWISRGIHRNAFDVVVSRAVFPLARFLERSSSFVKETGAIIAMKGRSVREEIENAEKTVFEKNLALVRQVTLSLPFSQEERHLLVFRGAGGEKPDLEL